MSLTSKQENMINLYLRGVAVEMERYLGPDERALRLGEMQRHVQQVLSKKDKPSIEDADVEAALKSAGKLYSRNLEDTVSRKRPNPQFKLMLTHEDLRWLGVCGGIAARFGLESWMVRALFFIFAIPAAPLVIVVYFGLYCWMYFASDRTKLPRFNVFLPVWRLVYTVGILYAMHYAAVQIREFIFFAHEAYLKRDVPPLGDWDWIMLWNDSFSSWALTIGVPFALLSGTPLRGGWSESLKRIPWALMALYFISISFGIASILVGIILDFVDEFTGDPGFIFQIFDLGS